ncbi:hypothetical protein [Halomicrobium salinisoli]|uniref:hypothetical protein n=1 Tax=Halomicrobium salinisoli TaxID=2878391 RepID=UPI001CEFE298|nr:hypothetical protein [Halomicrobium salinisoli]
MTLMQHDLVAPDGWRRGTATHLDRKYTPATPLAFEQERTGRRVEVIPTLVTAPGDDVTWHVRAVDDRVRVVDDGIEDREAALDRAREAMEVRS